MSVQHINDLNRMVIMASNRMVIHLALLLWPVFFLFVAPFFMDMTGDEEALLRLTEFRRLHQGSLSMIGIYALCFCLWNLIHMLLLRHERNEAIRVHEIKSKSGKENAMKHE